MIVMCDLLESRIIAGSKLGEGGGGVIVMCDLSESSIIAGFRPTWRT